MSDFEMVQDLLNVKADLKAQINVSVFDGSIEIKTVNDERYIYVRKRELGRNKSTYIGKYSEELYAMAINQSQHIRAAKKQLRKVEKELASLGYKEGALSPRVRLNIDFARANVKSLIGVLSLAVTKDATIKVVASGDDEALAVDEIVKLVESLED